MDYREFVESGVLQELDRVFTSEQRSRALLRNVGFALHYSPPFGSEFWPSVCEDISHGAIRGGLDTLLTEAARQFPGNAVFARNRHDTGTPTTSIHGGGTASPTSVRFVECADPTALLDAMRSAAVRLQIAAEINVGYVLDTSVCLHVDTSAEDALRMATAALVGNERLARLVAVHPFPDRMLEQLYVEGPDQDCFLLKEVPTSTRTREIARGVMEQYSGDVWPRDSRGRVRLPVVDHVRPDGTVERLSAEATLHDARVDDGDTLHVSPESVAGSDRLEGLLDRVQDHRRSGTVR